MSLAAVGGAGTTTTVGEAVVGAGRGGMGSTCVGTGLLFAATGFGACSTFVEGIAIGAQDEGAVGDAEVEVAVGVVRMMIAGGCSGTGGGASE